MNGGAFSGAPPSRLVLKPANKTPAVILEAVVIAATKIEIGLPGLPVTLRPQPKGLGRCTGSIGAMASYCMRATPPVSSPVGSERHFSYQRIGQGFVRGS